MINELSNIFIRTEIAQRKKTRWVLVRDPEGKKTDEVFFTTSRILSAMQIIEYYMRRWPLEITFQEVREHLGLETMRNRSRNAIIRSVPFLLSVYSIVIVWLTNLLVFTPGVNKISYPLLDA